MICARGAAISHYADSTLSLFLFCPVRRRSAFMAVTLLFLIVFFGNSSLAGRPDECAPASPAFVEDLLKQINRYRADNGRAPLLWDEGLLVSARGHSRRMCEEDTLSHKAFGERFRNSGRNYCVENVGRNAATGTDQFRQWKESAAHNENMLDKRIHIAGISKAGYFVTFFACE